MECCIVYKSGDMFRAFPKSLTIIPLLGYSACVDGS